MKKTFTLLAIAAFLTSASFAQNNHRNNDYENNNKQEIAGNGYGRESGTYYFSEKEKNMQIFAINKEYNKKIESVKHKLFMGRSKKDQLVCSLEMQRDAGIRFVIAKFTSKRNLFDGRDNRSHGHDRRHNW